MSVQPFTSLKMADDFFSIYLNTGDADGSTGNNSTPRWHYPPNQGILDRYKDQFTFKKHIVDECKEIVEECFEEPIALHIRRGDFLINSANHHNQTLDYYEEALNKFDVKRQVVIFSDDPKWCMEQELFSGDRFLVSEAAGPYHDLYLMTQCSDFIIANSSFSWWGAWLANRGKVIAPKKWFGPNNSHLNTKDLYCEGWEVI